MPMLWRSDKKVCSFQLVDDKTSYVYTDFFEFDKPSYNEVYVDEAGERDGKKFFRVALRSPGEGLLEQPDHLLPRLESARRRGHQEDPEPDAVPAQDPLAERLRRADAGSLREQAPVLRAELPEPGRLAHRRAVLPRRRCGLHHRARPADHHHDAEVLRDGQPLLLDAGHRQVPRRAQSDRVQASPQKRHRARRAQGRPAGPALLSERAERVGDVPAEERPSPRTGARLLLEHHGHGRSARQLEHHLRRLRRPLPNRQQLAHENRLPRRRAQVRRPHPQERAQEKVPRVERQPGRPLEV